MLDDLLVFRIFGEVMPFPGIVLVIVEFDAGFAVVPFGIAPAAGADGVAFGAAAADLGESGFFPGLWDLRDG